MNNVIKFTMAAGVLALMGCTDNNVSGAAIEGNAIAKNSSSSNATSSSSDVPVSIDFNTKATSSIELNDIEFQVYGDEKGAQAACSADEKSYTAKMRIKNGVIEKSMELKKFGSACDSVLQAFKASCATSVLVFDDLVTQKECSDDGSTSAICYDDRANPVKVCTASNPPVCSNPVPDTTVDFNAILNDFVTSSDNMCNALHEEGGDDVAPDSISFTLDEYTAQFTDNPEEISFDSHVLAYNAPIPFEAIFVTDGNVAMMTIPSSQSTILEVQTSEIPRFFPKMSSVAKDKLQKEGCKTYVVTDIDAGQPTGHVLTSVAKGTIEITSVIQGGLFATTNAYFPVAFLVQDCDGLIDVNSTVTSKLYTSKTWCNPEMMSSDHKETVPNPDCKAGASTYVSAYGEWLRTDLVK